MILETVSKGKKPMSKHLNSRAAAAKLSWQIIDKGQSLDTTLSNFFESNQYSPQDRGFIQELVYGVCRWYGELDAVATTLLRSPIRNKDRVIHFVLLVGLYQLRHLDTAEHAGVAETVSACKQLDKQWAKNVINGCLRNYLRAPSDVGEGANKKSHPEWISQAIQKAWPDHLNLILAANNQRPPMCIRVNRRQYKRDDYLTLLSDSGIGAEADQNSPDGIILDSPCAVTSLPGFEHGSCSVQDTAAQISADLLDVKIGMSVLDACAAPGGKTAHILERCDNKIEMHALDVSERRCQQLDSTLSRLELKADIFTADASIAPSWPLPNDGYDRILIDSPCSGLGVIRRHPDIKHHRRPSDIDALEKTQTSLLDNLWLHLKPGGIMLYMTCSVLPRENQLQIKRFVARTNDAMLINVPHPCALTLEHGVQTLPGLHGMDGFYYCLLQKQ
jgi:16S rRNA (cytosine967-C5)-methyltransferase